MAEKKVKKMQDSLVESAHKIWLAGLGALATGQEEGSKLFSTLVERGESFELSGKKHVEKAKGAVTDTKKAAESYWDTLGKTLEEKVSTVVQKTGVPSRREIEALTKKVDQLTEAIDKLQKKDAATRRTPATRKPAARKPAARKAPTAKKPATPKAAAADPETPK